MLQHSLHFTWNTHCQHPSYFDWYVVLQLSLENLERFQRLRYCDRIVTLTQQSIICLFNILLLEAHAHHPYIVIIILISYNSQLLLCDGDTKVKLSSSVFFLFLCLGWDLCHLWAWLFSFLISTTNPTAWKRFRTCQQIFLNLRHTIS